MTRQRVRPSCARAAGLRPSPPPARILGCIVGGPTPASPAPATVPASTRTATCGRAGTRPLPWFQVTLAPNGELEVDKDMIVPPGATSAFMSPVIDSSTNPGLLCQSAAAAGERLASVFRNPLPVSDLERAPTGFTNFFLHIQPVKVHEYSAARLYAGLGLVSLSCS